MKSQLGRRILALGLAAVLFVGDSMPVLAESQSKNQFETTIDVSELNSFDDVSGNEAIIAEEPELPSIEEPVANVETVEEAEEEYTELGETEIVALPCTYKQKVGSVNVWVTLSDERDIPEGAQLVVTEEVVTDEMYAAVDESLGEDAAPTELVAYDIRFELNGEEVEPLHSVTVEIRNADTDETTEVFHFTDDGVAENMDAEVEGSIVEFETDHFSTYLVVKSGETTNGLIKKSPYVTVIADKSWGTTDWQGSKEHWNDGKRWEGNNAKFSLKIEVYVDGKNVKSYPDGSYNQNWFYLSLSWDDRITNSDIINNRKESDKFTINVADKYDLNYVNFNESIITKATEGDDLGKYVVTDGINLIENTLQIYLLTKEELPDPSSLVETYTVGTLNLYNYAGNEINKNGKDWYGNDIKRPFMFVQGSSGINHCTSSGNVRVGIVKNKLKANGNPELSSGSDTSLDYLFPNTTNSGVTAVAKDVQKLFLKDSEGYYYFNSDVYYAKYYAAENKMLVTADGFKRFEPFATQRSSSDNVKASDNSTDKNFFGLTYETTFLQPKNGKLENNADMKFEFSGDDDVWVFIDDVLVLDLGGIHAEASGSINFATGMVERAQSEGENNGRVSETIKSKFEDAGIANLDEIFTTNDTFKNYSSHTMKVFYFERGAGLSNFKIKFNLQTVKKGSLVVRKTVEGKSSDSNDEYTFAVKEEGSASYLGNTSYILHSGSSTVSKTTAADGTFRLKADEFAEFELDSSKKYQVVELGVNAEITDVKIDEVKASVVDGTVTSVAKDIPAAGVATAVFENDFYSVIKVKKEVVGNTSTTDYSFTVKDASGKTVDSFVLVDGGERLIKVPAGAEYTVTELNTGSANVKVDGTAVAKDNAGNVSTTVTSVAAETKTVTFTNEYLSKIYIVKEVVGTPATNRDFEFTISKNGNVIENVKISSQGGTKEFDFPTGSEYVVTETTTDADVVYIDGVKVTNGVYSKTVVAGEGTDNTVKFTNEYHGSIVISKAVVGKSDKTSYSFTVKDGDIVVNTVSIEAGKSVTVDGLIAGKTYTIVENDVTATEVYVGTSNIALTKKNADDETKYVETTATATKAGTTVNFTNKYLSKIYVKKVVSGSTDKNEFSFTITGAGLPDNGESFKLANEQVREIEVISGEKYTITEVNVDATAVYIDGTKVETAYSKEVIAGKDASTKATAVVFKNEYIPYATLKVSKKVLGPQTALDGAYSFTIAPITGVYVVTDNGESLISSGNFTLKDGDTVEFKVPLDKVAEYTIAETELSASRVKKVSVKSGDTTEVLWTPDTNTSNVASKTVTMVADSENALTFVNDFSYEEFKTSKTAKVNDENARTFDITITADYVNQVYKEEEAKQAVEVYLVLDASSSMNSKYKTASGASETRRAALIRSAKNFVKVLREANPENKVAISIYADGEKESLALTSLSTDADYNAVIKKIENMGTNYSGTVVHESIANAKKLFASQTSSDGNYTVVFTDGNFNHKNIDNGKTSYPSCDLSDDTNLPELKKVSTIYAIGCGEYKASSLRTIASDSNKAIGCDDMSTLNAVFNQVANEIASASKVVSAKITDIIDPRFDLVGTPEGATVSADGRTVVWEVSSLSHFGITFTVKAKDDFLGGNAIYTNGPESKVELFVETQPYKTEYLDKPLVNVKKLALSASDETKTFFLGETIDEKTVLAALEGNVKFTEVDNKTTFAATSLLLEAEIATLLASKTYTKQYSYPGTNDVVGELIYSIVLDPAYKGATSYSHTATEVGKAVEQYKLTVQYVPYAIENNKRGSFDVEGTPVGTVVVSDASVTGTYTIDVIDGTITIVKEIGADVEWTDGDPIFMFTITNTETGKSVTKIAHFEKPATGNVETTFTIHFVGLEKGQYKVEELKTLGYKLESASVLSAIKVGDVDFNIDTYGVTVNSDKTVSATLGRKGQTNEFVKHIGAKFVNKKLNEYFMDRDEVINSVKVGKNGTVITPVYSKETYEYTEEDAIVDNSNKKNWLINIIERTKNN